MQTPYGQFGPGGGSIPAWVMRTGMTAPFNPLNARRDISVDDVHQTTMVPVGQEALAIAEDQPATPGTSPISGAFGAPGFGPIPLRGRPFYGTTRRGFSFRRRRLRGLPPGMHGAPPALGVAPAFWTALSTPKKVAVGVGGAVALGLAVWGITKLV